MRSEKRSGNEIGLDGRFRNPIREKAFREWELAGTLPVLRVLIASLGLVFVCFIFPDFLMLGPGTVLFVSAALRLLFLALALLIAFHMRRPASLGVRELEFLLLTAGALVVFWAELWLYRGQNAFIQAMGVMLMIIVVFLLPIRLVLSVAAALLVAAEGGMNLFLASPPLPRNEVAAVLIDFFLCMALATTSSLRTGRARRQEFVRAEELQALSRTDLLTGLANRRSFEETLRETVGRCARHGEEAALIMIDLDRFKDVNDDFGHEVGDRVLEEFAERLSGAVRLTDRPARWGGEEFAVILPLTNMTEAVELAERLRKVVADEPFEGVKGLSASFGVTVIRPDDETGESVLRADRALYTAKRNGRNRVEFEA